MTRYVFVKDTKLAKGGVFTYNVWRMEGRIIEQFEIFKTSDHNIWVNMLYPKDPKDGVVRKKVLKDDNDGFGAYFGFNYYGNFQKIYLDFLEKDKIIKKNV
jgi:hypothetical protein